MFGVVYMCDSYKENSTSNRMISFDHLKNTVVREFI